VTTVGSGNSPPPSTSRSRIENHSICSTRRWDVHETLGCGSLRRAGNGGWYWEVNRLSDISSLIVPFFERFPLVGQKANDFDLFRSAVALLAKSVVGDDDYVRIIQLRERMNRGGKRRYSAERILRDYTPTPPMSMAG
jgi:LAGLIDADG endonuclease